MAERADGVAGADRERMAIALDRAREAAGHGDVPIRAAIYRGDELLAALRRMQSDPAHRDLLARRAQDAFRENWCESAVVPRYLDIIRRAAQRRGA